MSIPILPFVIVLLIFMAGVYSAYSKRSKIFCWFEGEDGTDEFKWITNKDGYIIFRGFKFDIVKDRITSLWWTSGIHKLFPTRVNCLKYSWYSRFPHDPRNYGLTVISPRVRKSIDKAEMVKSYFQTSTPTTTTRKEGFIQRWMPLIAVGVIVIMGYYFYTNMQSLSAGLAALQNQINAITK